jgi:hypothetical protein
MNRLEKSGKIPHFYKLNEYQETKKSTANGT